MGWKAFVGGVLLAACGSTAQVRPPVEPAPRTPEPPPAAAAPAPLAAERASDRQESNVHVRGIEGSMSSYDVNQTMERRSDELSACHAPRVRAVPALSGAIEYAIKVDAEGNVGDVTVKSSDVGDLVLERCIGEVIHGKPFPRPNGGDAKFTWSMTLEPAYASAAPEAWEAGQVDKALDKYLPDLHEACSDAKPARLGAIAYVNKKGRVVAASITPNGRASDEELDCLIGELRKWSMPRPKQSRFAKVSFSLSLAGRPRVGVKKVSMARPRPNKKR
jgi:hypothetical protein